VLRFERHVLGHQRLPLAFEVVRHSGSLT
jgi:hypothetical protein